VARGDALDLEILGSIASQLEYLGGEILQNSGQVDGSLCSDASLLAGDVAEMTLDTAAGELQSALSQRCLLIYLVVTRRTWVMSL